MLPHTQIGQVGRADAAAGLLGEEALDAAVLERVEGERGDAAADLRGRSHASGSASSSWVSSPLTAIRIAWKVRLAGWPPAKRAGAGIAAVIASLSSKVVVELRAAAAADDLARDPVREALLAVLAQRAREPAAVPGVDDLVRRQLLVGSIRMSSGAS